MLIWFLLLSVAGFIFLIWKFKISDEERKKIQEENIRKKNQDEKLKNYRENETVKNRENGSDDKIESIIGFIFFSLLFFVYFYNVVTDPKFTLGFVGYLLIIIFIIGCFVMINQLFKSEKKYQENSKELNKDQKINLQYTQSSFDDFIAGRMSLAKCFWLYFIFIGIIISVISGYIFELGHSIILIIPVAYYVLISVSLWNCATLYSNEKLFNKQPYGWAISVKIIIVLNIILTVSQIGSILLNK
jgi:Flp pilus assembly protein TadB